MNKCILFCFFYFLSFFSAWAGIEGEVSSYSNFIWRGTTFSENKPALQVTLDAQEDHGFFIGSFISKAEFSDEDMGKNSQVNQEIDYTFGKRWQSQDWELQLSYNRFTFPGAEVFNTDEFNLFLNYKRFILELSYMDDYFGYQSAYRYIRIGHEWTYTSTFGATFFAGYNAFARPKGGIKSRCLDSSCSEVAQTTNGAGNPDYIDLFLTHRKILKNHFVLELALNWTNRDEFIVDSNTIIKQHAKDFAAVVGIVIPFNL
jgi:hypothetical protein